MLLDFNFLDQIKVMARLLNVMMRLMIFFSKGTVQDWWIWRRDYLHDHECLENFFNINNFCAGSLVCEGWDEARPIIREASLSAILSDDFFGGHIIYIIAETCGVGFRSMDGRDVLDMTLSLMESTIQASGLIMPTQGHARDDVREWHFYSVNVVRKCTKWPYTHSRTPWCFFYAS
jgi:hypothetical protein